MGNMKGIAAVDIGGSGGKAVLFGFDGNRLTEQSKCEFANRPILKDRKMLVDVPALEKDLYRALGIFAREGFASVGIDTWGGSYVYVDASGRSTDEVYNCRDLRMASTYKKLSLTIDEFDIFRRTGVPLSRFCVLSQVIKDMEDGILAADEREKKLLLMPNYLSFLLSGQRYNDASTVLDTCMAEPNGLLWNRTVFDMFGVPREITTDIAPVGTRGGPVIPKVRDATGCGNADVIQVAGHDTMCAVASIPNLTDRDCFVSIGTTIIVGAKTRTGIRSREAYDAGYKNTVGVFGSNYLCRDITGFFLINECIKQLRRQGQPTDFDALHDLAAEAEDIGTVLDIGQDVFKRSNDNMIDVVRDSCRQTGQRVPNTTGELVRIIFNSYAAAIGRAMNDLGAVLSGSGFENVYIISGRTHNTLLMQMIAGVLGRPVLAGIPNATVLGNALIQLVATEEAKSDRQLSEIAARSCSLTEYRPVK